MNSPLPPPGSQRRWLRWIICLAILFCVLIVLAWFAARFDSGRSKQAETRDAVAIITAALRQYHVEYEVLPTGNNAQIVAALLGNNPRKVLFLGNQSHNINNQGEFIDAWKTPCHIDTSQAGVPKVYSCGHDRQDNGGAAGSDDIVSWR